MSMTSTMSAVPGEPLSGRTSSMTTPRTAAAAVASSWSWPCLGLRSVGTAALLAIAPCSAAPFCPRCRRSSRQCHAEQGCSVRPERGCRQGRRSRRQRRAERTGGIARRTAGRIEGGDEVVGPARHLDHTGLAHGCRGSCFAGCRRRQPPRLPAASPEPSPAPPRRRKSAPSPSGRIRPVALDRPQWRRWRRRRAAYRAVRRCAAGRPTPPPPRPRRPATSRCRSLRHRDKAKPSPPAPSQGPCVPWRGRPRRQRSPRAATCGRRRRLCGAGFLAAQRGRGPVGVQIAAGEISSLLDNPQPIMSAAPISATRASIIAPWSGPSLRRKRPRNVQQPESGRRPVRRPEELTAVRLTLAAGAG